MKSLIRDKIADQEIEIMFDFLSVLSECRQELCSLEESHVQELVLMLDSRKKIDPKHFALQCRLYLLKWTMRHWEKTKALADRHSISAPHRDYLIRRFAEFYCRVLEQDGAEVKNARVLRELQKNLARGFEQIIAQQKSHQKIMEELDMHFRYSEHEIARALKNMDSEQKL